MDVFLYPLPMILAALATLAERLGEFTARDMARALRFGQFLIAVALFVGHVSVATWKVSRVIVHYLRLIFSDHYRNAYLKQRARDTAKARAK